MRLCRNVMCWALLLAPGLAVSATAPADAAPPPVSNYDAALAKAGKLALAGPFSEDPDGWRGLFVFAVDTIDEAKQLTSTDPVIINGEMVAEYHTWHGSAATMMVGEIHEKLTP